MNKITIALAAGFVAGILLAPRKGSETRKKLNDGFDDFADGIDRLKSKFKPKAKEVDLIVAVPRMSDDV